MVHAPRERPGIGVTVDAKTMESLSLRTEVFNARA